jgi:CrcB protein
MIKIFTLIGLGGALGSIGRYLVAQYVQSRFMGSTFPYGTLIVNITGCFLIGLIFGLLSKSDILSEWKLFLVTGICGGYTTFSAFSYESITLLRNGEISHFCLYIAGSVILGLIATLIPVVVMQKI